MDAENPASSTAARPRAEGREALCRRSAQTARDRTKRAGVSRRLWAPGLGLLLLLGLAATASAAGLRRHDLRFGQNAMAMGGAVVGFVNGPEAAYYNPAGLGYLTGSQFSGALQYYGSDKRTLQAGLRSPTLGSADLRSDSFFATPTSSVITHAFAGGRHRIAYSTFLVTNESELFAGSRQGVTDDGILRRESLLKVSWRAQDQVLYMGPSYALRLSESLCVGVSVFAARRSQTFDLAADEQRDEFDSQTDAFRQAVFFDDYASVSLDDWSLLARIGVMWTPTSAFSAGLTLHTRSLALSGQGNESIRSTYSGDILRRSPADRVSVGGPLVGVQSATPWAVAAGLGWRPTPSLLVAATGEWSAALRYDRFQVDAFSDGPANVVRTIEHQMSWNAALGLEWLVDPKVPIRAGAFTNRSSAPPVPLQSDRRVSPQVSMMGATLSVGYIGDQRSFNVGAEFAVGSGHDSVLSETAQWDSGFVRVEREQQRFMLFLSGAMAFAQETAKEQIKRRFLTKPPAADEPPSSPGTAPAPSPAPSPDPPATQTPSPSPAPAPSASPNSAPKAAQNPPPAPHALHQRRQEEPHA